MPSNGLVHYKHLVNLSSMYNPNTIHCFGSCFWVHNFTTFCSYTWLHSWEYHNTIWIFFLLSILVCTHFFAPIRVDSWETRVFEGLPKKCLFSLKCPINQKWVFLIIFLIEQAKFWFLWKKNHFGQYGVWS